MTDAKAIHDTGSSDGDSSDAENESLSRMSEQVRRRQGLSFIYDDEDMADSDGSDYDRFGPDVEHDVNDGQYNSEDDYDQDTNNETDSDSEQRRDDNLDRDGRVQFLRALNSLYNGTHNNQSLFTDAIHRLMADENRGFTSSANNEIENLVDILLENRDSSTVLATLNELSEKLLMTNAIEAERTVPSYKLAQALAAIMTDTELLQLSELQLVACRCLYNFLEVNPDFTHDVIDANVIAALCHKLNEISFIDLTEQVLQTLEMISRDPGSYNQIIQHQGLRLSLQYLDFLTIHSQRKCMQIVAHCCNHVLYQNFGLINDTFESISNIVTMSSDSVVLENCWLCICRVIESFQSYPDLLETLFLERPQLVNELSQTIIASSGKASAKDAKAPVNFSTCISLIESLITLTSCSVNLSVVLLSDIHIGKVIVKSINDYTRQTDNDISAEAIMSAPNDLIGQYLTLIGYLLPISYLPQETPFLDTVYEESADKKQINLQRLQVYRESIANDFLQFVNDVWRFLVHSFQASMDFEVRRKALVNIFRVVKFYANDNINQIVDFEAIFDLLSALISQSKTTIVREFDSMIVDTNANTNTNTTNTASLTCLSCCVIILNLVKISLSFIAQFEKEGVLNDIAIIHDHLQAYATTNSVVASRYRPYWKRFADVEFIKHEPHLTNARIYREVFQITYDIAGIYHEWKTDSVDASAHMQALATVKLSLKNRLTENQYREIWDTLVGIFANNVSSFELISSGIISSLINSLTNDSLAYQTFRARVFDGTEESPAIRLVEHLQAALNRLESFEIVTTGHSDPSNDLPTSNPSSQTVSSLQTAGMARQVKLKLVADNSGDWRLPSTMSSMVVSIQAIATLQSIEMFVKNRLQWLGLFSGRSQFDTDDNDDTVTDIDSDPTTRDQFGIAFFINDEVVPNSTTIYGAIYRYLQAEPDDIVDASKIWNAVHEIHFRKCPPGNDTVTAMYEDETDLEPYDPDTIRVLKLLKIIYDMNRLGGAGSGLGAGAGSVSESESGSGSGSGSVSADLFTNWKLTIKLNRQLEDPLVVASGTLPGWAIHITRQFPFIYPFGTRMFFLQSTSFGYSRLIHQWQLRTHYDPRPGTNTHQRVLLGRPLRRKVRILRKLIFASAMKVLSLYGTSPGILEIEYFHEEGSGLGPTLEFYSTVCQEFCKRKLRLWRDSWPQADPESFVDAPYGLFPAPYTPQQLSTDQGQRILATFSFLGQFIARALLDSRILDFNFHPLFLELIQQYISPNPKHGHVTVLQNLKALDASLADSMEYLLKYMDGSQQDGTSLDDMSLSFQLPGYPEYELVAQGDRISVTRDNVKEFVDLVMDHSLNKGIQLQIEAFAKGFSKVFPINSLNVFSATELADLFGSAAEDWSYDTIASAINANHGYTKESDIVEKLVKIMLEFSVIEQRSFLQFLTGAPKLPIGGFKCLNPELTVVRKVPEGNLGPDDYLPSVMTCANYLKLPAYSSEEVMRERLLTAVREGAGAFLLS